MQQNMLKHHTHTHIRTPAQQNPLTGTSTDTHTDTRSKTQHVRGHVNRRNRANTHVQLDEKENLFIDGSYHLITQTPKHLLISIP